MTNAALSFLPLRFPAGCSVRKLHFINISVRSLINKAGKESFHYFKQRHYYTVRYCGNHIPVERICTHTSAPVSIYMYTLYKTINENRAKFCATYPLPSFIIQCPSHVNGAGHIFDSERAPYVTACDLVSNTRG